MKIKNKTQKLIFAVVFFALLINPARGLTFDIDNDTDAYLETLPQQQEENYLREFLSTRVKSRMNLEDFLIFLRTNNFYSKSPAQKKALLLQINANKQYTFSWFSILAIAGENNIRWGENYFSVDYFFKTCSGESEKLKAREAVAFFTDNLCKIQNKSVPKDKALFFTKANWSAEALNNLYSSYWSDLGNFRFRPVFSEQELNRLISFDKMLSKYFPDQVKSGSICIDLLAKQGTEFMFDIATTVVAPEKIALQSLFGETTDALVNRLLRSREPSSRIRSSELKFVLKETEDGSPLIINVSAEETRNRWATSGIPSDYWKDLDDELVKRIQRLNEFDPMQTLSPSESKQLIQKLLKVDYSTATASVHTPSGVMNIGTEHSNTNDDIFEFIYFHELQHYIQQRNIGAGRFGNSHLRASPQVQEALTRQGRHMHNPIEESLADLSAYYSTGRVYEIPENGGKVVINNVGTEGWGYSNEPFLKAFIMAVRKKYNLSLDDSIKLILSKSRSGETTTLINSLLPGGAPRPGISSQDIQIFLTGDVTGSIRSNSDIYKIFGLEVR